VCVTFHSYPKLSKVSLGCFEVSGVSGVWWGFVNGDRGARLPLLSSNYRLANAKMYSCMLIQFLFVFAC